MGLRPRRAVEAPPVTVQPGRYRHFKGNEYVVLGTARHSETEEVLVVYRPASSEEWWVRPLAMFTETVEHEGRIVHRFEWIG